MQRAVVVVCLFFSGWVHADWFDDIKQSATNDELHQLLFEMPKGGDLHHHLTGSIFSDWWYELATADDGYNYYTKVRINNCRVPGEAGFEDYLLHYRNIAEFRYKTLSECEKGEYLPLRDLSDAQKRGWMDSLRLEKPTEGRDEFFRNHWQRLGDLNSNPNIGIGILLRNMQAFADEGMIYAEPQVSVLGFTEPDGTPISPDAAAAMFRDRLEDKDFKATGMTTRFQMSILRFVPDAELHLKMAYEFVATNEPWVAVNMVGREDDDKGHPLRFLSTIRELRHTYNNVQLSIHAGEVDEPNGHIRDTLLLGADRIGHGLNLITDPDTMRLMRHGPYMVEINLISNLLLEYVDDYAKHPFPEYLRIGIPVALSTDDRGMWDSTMTDEFFVAVREFNLSWREIKQLSENSLKYAFVPDDIRTELLKTYRTRIRHFEQKLEKKGLAALKGRVSPKHGFICRQYELCAP